MAAGNVEQKLKNALKEHENGDFERAKELYGEIIAQNPNNPDALHLLGVIALQKGETETAIDLITSAINFNPMAAPFHTNLGTAYKAHGEKIKAIECFYQALIIDENCFEAQNNLASSLMDVGNLEDARDHYEKALLIKDETPDTYNNLGKCYLELGETDKAISCFTKSLSMQPKFALAYNNLGKVMLLKQNHQQAISNFKKALNIRPNLVDARVNLGVAHEQIEDYDSALFHYQEAIKQSPDNINAIKKLAKLLVKIGMIEAAEMALNKLIELNPEDSQSYCLYADTLIKTGNYTSAKENLALALELSPNDKTAYNLLATIDIIYNDLANARNHLEMALQSDKNFLPAMRNLAYINLEEKNYIEAIKLYKKVLKHDTNDCGALSELYFAQSKICDFNNAAQTNLLLKAAITENLQINNLNIKPFIGLACGLPRVINQQIAIDYAKNYANFDQFNSFVCENKPLKIGYISPDFNDKAAGLLIRSVFAFHNRNDFKIFAYHIGDKNKINEKVKQSVDEFKLLGSLSPSLAANIIYEDEINILVDLCGYAKRNRLDILAFKPAPIIVEMLGYPGTMGANFIDYLLTTEVALPAHLSDSYNEKVIYLKNTPFATAPFSDPKNHNVKRKDYNLPDNKFIFCSFIETYRITSTLIKSWMKILAKAPDSVLWLGISEKQARENIIKEARNHDIDEDRIIFSEKENLSEKYHHKLADLYLDGFNFSSGTNTILSLFAALPILSLQGATQQSRTGASFLAAGDMSELIVDSVSEYEKSAIGLYHSPKRLKEIRAKMEKMRFKSPLFKPQEFIYNLETVYQILWEKYCNNEPCAHLSLLEKY